MDVDLITRIAAALRREDVRYKVVGAIALNAHGIARGTQALDLFVEPSDTNIARLRDALESVFAGDPSLDEISASDLAGDYPAIQYVSPDGAFSIDILARLGEAFGFDDLEVLAIAGAGAPRRMVPGVHKFPSIEAWNAANERREQLTVEAAADRTRGATSAER